MIRQGWEAVIGLETHVQLTTASKIFSTAPTAFGAAPNTQANAVDLALPGTLPVLNRAAVECAIKFGLAVNGGSDRHVALRSVFARKNYFYPDLPKGYQISQYELPIVTGGQVDIEVGGKRSSIQLTRAHLEEDAGKSLHEGLETPGVSGIDLNRAGTPLLEIVTEPVMHSAEEAVAYAKALHGIVTWIGICDGNMQEGSFRCDANVSVRRVGDTRLGTRAEIKNVNSFRFLEKAIDHEIRRQIELIEDGGSVVQETRLYDAERNETRSMRSKEDAMDYRYFPDPDLLPVAVSREWVAAVRETMGELPEQKRQRFVAELGIAEADARVITLSRSMTGYFEALVAALGGAPKLAATWMVGEFSAALNRAGIDWKNAPISADRFAKLLQRVQDNTISGKAAKDVFDFMWSDALQTDVDAIIAAKGLKQVSDSAAIEKLVDAAIAANPKAVEEYRAGKDKALNALFGQVMKASNKTANPGQVTELLKKKLAG
ncbi:MAG TPA: Asp-tRNA(Asn)/Glu-tRNA(Gln) amidotransferase subunit GatB [Usitatibacteraceae bacterium]|nr:Asp-tRNA(Asn)/Glu-tRNA(Gln) amidotransferase subunit GatB [Usitatibacteraceae bacterium]